MGMPDLKLIWRIMASLCPMTVGQLPAAVNQNLPGGFPSVKWQRGTDAGITLARCRPVAGWRNEGASGYSIGFGPGVPRPRDEALGSSRLTSRRAGRPSTAVPAG